MGEDGAKGLHLGGQKRGDKDRRMVLWLVLSRLFICRRPVVSGPRRSRKAFNLSLGVRGGKAKLPGL